MGARKRRFGRWSAETTCQRRVRGQRRLMVPLLVQRNQKDLKNHEDLKVQKDQEDLEDWVQLELKCWPDVLNL